VPGMGRLLVESVKSNDRELFLSITLCAGVLGLIGYLLADILYAVVDPRVSYE
jgi:peptide/nickel transport system permease protein